MTHDELKEARESRGLTQIKMAELLNVPVSTYRKWEQGERKVPGIVANSLAGKKVEVKHLTSDEAMEFARKTSSQGLDPDQVVADLIREWTKRTIAIALFCFVGWQIFHPHDDQFARRFGRRREGGVDGIEMMGEA